MNKKNARRSRKGALQDSVSCPPKISHSSLGVPKIQLSSLIGDIPEDEEVNNVDLPVQVSSNDLLIKDQHNEEMLVEEYEEKESNSELPPESLSRSKKKSSLDDGDEQDLEGNVSSRAKYGGPPKEVIKRVDDYRQTRSKTAHYRGNRRQKNFSSQYRDAPNASMVSSLATWDSASMFSTGQTMFTRAIQRPSWGHYVVGLLVFLAWTLHHAYHENLNSYLNSVNSSANLGHSRVYDSRQYDRAQRQYDRVHQVRGSMSSNSAHSDYGVEKAQNAMVEKLKTAALN
mmetsp:Transcript_30933/g.46945  ORF Transcript_30933/g.46945 Transcript_30933/m.46945 type:complete len:286 (-) Transcript_30933:108-965(-)